MIEANHLHKFLYIADMAIGCDVCCKNTWNADEHLTDDDIYVRQLWHEETCPLYKREDVYAIFGDLDKKEVTPYHGRLLIKKLKLGDKISHSLWLKSNSVEYRIVSAHEHFADIDMVPLDGREANVLGVVYGDALYASMIITS